jgi:Holliday junction resolvase-like predicted endonuclease
MELEEIEEMIRKGKTVEEILSAIDWREFEEKVEEIFKRHNFKTRRNFRFKTSKRFEVDIVAEKRDLVFIVDCKHWGKGRYKTYPLKKAAEKQMERAKAIKQTFLACNRRIIPIIITLFDECVYEFEGVFIVPVFKLNAFLLDY